MIRQCVVCGKSFNAKTSGKYCSHECLSTVRKLHVRATWQTKTCPRCGKTFETKDGRTKYCSRECVISAMREQARERKRNTPIITKICVGCGKTFETKYPNKKYCSEPCKIAHKPYAGQAVFCQTCGRQFMTTRTEMVYCPECWNERKQARIQSLQKLAKSKTVDTKTLDEWALESRECHLDYGTYRALLNSGKTFAELKALAGERPITCHSHCHGFKEARQ